MRTYGAWRFSANELHGRLGDKGNLELGVWLDSCVCSWSTSYLQSKTADGGPDVNQGDVVLGARMTADGEVFKVCSIRV